MLVHVIGADRISLCGKAKRKFVSVMSVEELKAERTCKKFVTPVQFKALPLTKQKTVCAKCMKRQKENESLRLVWRTLSLCR